MPHPVLEICVDSPAGLLAALEGGAERIELCAALSVGGLTPSPGLIRMAAAQRVPVIGMVRPRAGDFVFSEAEVQSMLDDIDVHRAAGLAGVALGASRPDGRLDLAVLERLVEAAAGMELVLHRCFDLVPDRGEAIEAAARLGFARILTSGGASTASGGVAEIAEAIEQAGGRIAIMPCGGITAANIDALLDRLAVGDVHASCGVSVAASRAATKLGFAMGAERQTDQGRVRSLRQAILRHEAAKRRST